MRLGNLSKLFNDQGVSSHLPYTTLETDDILLTDQEDRIRTWKVNGIPIDSADIEKIYEALHHRKVMFTHLPYGDEFRVHHTLIRSKEHFTPPSDVSNAYAARFLNDYYAQFKQTPLYKNEHYISLIHRLPSVKRKKFNLFLKHTDSQESYKKRQEKSKARIDEASKFVEQHLSTYGIKRLGKIENDSNELLSFISKLLNLEYLPLWPQPIDLKYYLPHKRLFFGDKIIEIQDPISQKRTYATLLALKGFVTKKTEPTVLDKLLTLPIEFILTQSFELIPRHKADEQIELHEQRLFASSDPDIEGQDQLHEARGALSRGDFAMGNSELTILVISDNIHDIEDHISSIHHALLDKGISTVRDSFFMELPYWSQFPGNHQYTFRNIPINSGNMGCLASLHTKTTGNKKTHWGQPLLLLSTPQKTPYWFNFHATERDVGDALVIGAKGSGKTVLLTGAATAALQYPNSRVFYFDKDFGAENWIHATGGNHIILGTGEKTGLNPLQLPDTLENRKLLSYWLISLAEPFGNKLTEGEMTLIRRAVDHNYEDLPSSQRTLSNLTSVFGRGGSGSLKQRFSHWIENGEYAFYFDNPTDNINLNNQVTGLEMHYLLQDSQSVARFPVLLYLFHRIRMVKKSANAYKTLSVIDEALALLDHDFFEKEFRNALLTDRKLDAINVFAGQSPEAFLKSKLGKILIEETVTKAFFRPNSPTEETYIDGYNFTQGEYNALCSIIPGSRAFLLKQPDHSIVCDYDLSSLSNHIPILSSRPKGREKVLEKIKENPDQWWENVLNKNINIYD